MNGEIALPEVQRITIGRAEDNNCVLLPGDIGRYHAVIIVKKGESYILEDLGSKHGTYVDGVKIGKKVVSIQDKVSFATNEYFIKDLLIQANVIEAEKDPNDFTLEFAKLKSVYDKFLEFQADERKERHKIERRKSNLRLASTLIGLFGGMILGFILRKIVKNTEITSVGSGFGAWLGLSSLIQITGERILKFDEPIKNAYERFEENWKCPRCGDKSQFHRQSWKALANQKRCSKCNANWVK